MIPIFNKSLFLAIRPRNLSEFYIKVLNKPKPTIEERGKLFEYLRLGPAFDYLGTAGQNQTILETLYIIAEQE